MEEFIIKILISIDPPVPSLEPNKWAVLLR